MTAKQRQVYDCVRNERPKLLVCHGAKRAGKTQILVPCFLGQVAKYKKQKFIIGGPDQATIRRNVLDEIEQLMHREIKLDSSNGFQLMGNTVYCFGGKNSDSWKAIRGFTAAGAFLNEGTALHDRFVKEAISRCSYPDAMTFIDTNTEGPSHPIKTDYIDKAGHRLSSGRLNIAAFGFALTDNEFLDPEYVESIIATTPSGMFTDRDIYGKWVNPEGSVYVDFNDKNYITRAEAEQMQFVRYYAGVDWGYKHYGAIVVLGETADGTVVLLFEEAKQFKEIDYWVGVANRVKEQFGNIYFYCDSARPEYVTRFKNEGVQAFDAHKEILSGIEAVAKLIKTGKFKVVKENAPRFKEEIGKYVWDSKSGLPVKVDDDVMDAVRYAVYSRVVTRPKVRILRREDIIR